MPVRDVIANCSILFPDVPFSKRPVAARDAGFRAVEFWWPFDRAVPDDHAVERFVSSIVDAGVILSCLNFAAGRLDRGERGLLSNPAHDTEFRDSVDVAISIGDQLGKTGSTPVGFNALYGNRIDDLAPELQDETATANLAFAAERASTIGASVLIEPLSGVPGHPITTVADAVAVIDRVSSGSIRVLADLYHLAVNGEDIATTIDTFTDRIGHIQIADAPGRGEPGTGAVDLVGILRRLVVNGYDGLVAAEYVPSRSDTFDWLFGADSEYAALIAAFDTVEAVDHALDTR